MLTWKWKILLLFIGIFLALAGLEAALRIRDSRRVDRKPFPPAAASLWEGAWAEYDPDLIWRARPNFAEFNSEGFRDYPVGEKKHRFRVLVLGDSIAAFGDNLEDTLVAHVRKSAVADSGAAHVQFVNAATPGYTNYQQLPQLKKIHRKLKPDLVGVIFCLNDMPQFNHSVSLLDGRTAFEALILGVRPQPEQGWLRRQLNKSLVFQKTQRNLPVAYSRIRKMIRSGYPWEYNDELRPAWEDNLWPKIENQLKEMKELGRSNEFKVFLVSLPVVSQFDADYLAKDAAYVRKPQSKLREICARLEIEFLDLLPKLQAEHLQRDGIHLTRTGRQIAGAQIAYFLLERRLIPTAEATPQRSTASKSSK